MKVVYKAEDGQEFSEEQECKEYEDFCRKAKALSNIVRQEQGKICSVYEALRHLLVTNRIESLNV